MVLDVLTLQITECKTVDSELLAEGLSVVQWNISVSLLNSLTSS